MKLVQTTIEKNFFVEHRGRMYYVNYLNSDGQILELLNRDEWEIMDEDHEKLKLYEFQASTKKEKAKIRKNQKLADELIKFCTEHFEEYAPELEGHWIL